MASTVDDLVFVYTSGFSLHSKLAYFLAGASLETSHHWDVSAKVPLTRRSAFLFRLPQHLVVLLVCCGVFSPVGDA